MADTRSLILDAAERLYAERGLDGVSLRQITEAAGQRNNAAVHYHFGGRDGLVRALFEQRYAQLEERRAEMLAALDAAGRADDLAALVEVLIGPFAEAADADDGYWVRFVARLHEDPRYNPFTAHEPYGATPDVMAASRDVTARIRARLDLPAAVADVRFYIVTTMAVHAVADRQAMAEAELGSPLPAGPELLDALVEAAVAVLTR